MSDSSIAIICFAAPIILILICLILTQVDSILKSLSDKRRRVMGRVACIGLAVIFCILCTYVQGAGEVVLLRNWDGTVTDGTAEAGLHIRAPWPLQSRLTWNICNRRLCFSRDYYSVASGKFFKAESIPECIYEDGSCSGASVAVADSSGARAGVDVQVVYSLDAAKARDLYLDYGDQESFISGYIFKDARAVVAETAGSFDSIALLTDRARYSAAVKDVLAERWRDLGITVEAVQVQDVRLEDSAGDD